MKIPKDVSGIRKKFAQAAVLRKRSTITTPEQGKDPRVEKARQEAIKSRRELQEKNKRDAERETEVQELKAKLAEAEKLRDEYEPAAKRWQAESHKEKETLIAVLPKEMHRDARDMDVKHLRLFVNAYTGTNNAGAGDKGGGNKGAKIGSLDEATKADAATYNKFMDDVKAGTIKIDSEGKVLT